MLFSYYTKRPITTVLTFILVLLDSLLGLVFAYVLKRLLDIAVAKDLNALITFLIWTVVIFAIGYLISYFRKVLEAKVIRDIALDIKGDLYAGFHSISTEKTTNDGVGSFISMFLNDISLVKENYYKNIFSLVYSLTRALSSLVYLVYMNIWLAVIVVLFGALPLLVSNMFKHKIAQQSSEYEGAMAGFTAKINDLLSGLTVLKFLGGFHQSIPLFTSANKEMEDSEYSLKRLYALVNTLSDCGATASFIAIFGGGAFLAIRGSISVGAMVSSIQLVNGIVFPLASLSDNFNRLKTAKTIEAKFSGLMQSGHHPSGSINIENFSNGIRLENVNFAYQPDQDVLKNITLEIPKGQKMAIIGESGSGKSTLFKQLLRQYLPNSGGIYIDGVNMRDVAHDSISKIFSFVDQNPYVFHNTLRFNLSLGEDYSDEQLLEALEKANLLYILEKLPAGLDSDLGENGRLLSVGERQRLGIARALVRNVQVLLLDEPTSALDQASEEYIKNTIYNLPKEKTVIIIAHRLSTIENMDQIVVLSQGEIKKIGRPEEVLAQTEDGYLKVASM